MVYDKSGLKNRSRVPESEDRQVNEFARRHGITAQRALEVIAEAGGNRNLAEAIMASAAASQTTARISRSKRGDEL